MSAVNPDYPIISGVLHAPYFIFLRGSPLPTDLDVLGLLGLHRWSGLRNYGRLPLTDDLPGGDYVYLGEQGGWLLIADDWFYHLWHRKDRPQLLERLAAGRELVALRRPDVDESYEFVHFREGRRVRERRVDSPHYTDRVVAIDVGTPLPCESEVLYARDPDEIVWTVAAELGVPRTHDRATLRRYGRS